MEIKVNIRRNQPPANPNVAFETAEAAETVVATQQQGYLKHMNEAATHRAAAAAKTATIDALLREIAERQDNVKRLEDARTIDENTAIGEEAKARGFESVLNALGGPLPPLPSPTGLKAVPKGNPYPETGTIMAVDSSLCQACGNPMVWDDKQGFIHPIDGGHVAAGELCRLPRSGDTQALPAEGSRR